MVSLGRHVALHRARHAAIVLLLLQAVGLLVLSLLESRQALKLRAAKGGWASGLEGAAEEQLRGKQRRELHIKSRAWGHVMAIGLVLAHVLGVERGNVGATRVTVSKARDVGGEGSMRKASIAVGRLGSMAEARTVGTVRRSLASRSIEFLHPEKVRGDKGVPPSVTKNSRFERFQRAQRRHENRRRMREIRAADWSRTLIAEMLRKIDLFQKENETSLFDELGREVHHRSNRCNIKKGGTDEWTGGVCMQKRLFVFIEADYELIVENVQFPRIADIKKAIICKLLTT